MRYSNRSLWQPVGNIILEENALKAVKEDMNTLVIAGPGAGKTEMLAQRACYLLQTNQCIHPKKILAISFKKDAAVNLSERVEKRCGKELSSRFISKTFDSFSKNLLDNFYHGFPEDYKPNRSYAIATNDNSILKAFNSVGVRKPSGMTNKIFIKRLKDALIAQKLPLPMETNGDLILKSVWDVLLKGNGELTPNLSFPMISRLSEYVLRENPLIKLALRQSYSHVFLDEFQDTTELQYDLLKTCFGDSSSILTAVGDSKQRIMTWAGAKENIFDEFKSDFNAHEKKLIMNHRSAPRLLEIQKVLYNYLEEDEIVIKSSEKRKEDEGIAELWNFPTSEKEAEILSGNIAHMINNEKVPPRDICIIVKQTPDIYGIKIIEHLKKYGIVARNESVYQDFLKENIVNIIFDAIITSCDKRNPKTWTNTFNIYKLLSGFDDNNQFSKINVLTRDLKRFLNETSTSLSTISSIEELSSEIWKILNFFNFDSIKGAYPQYGQGSYVNKLIDDLIEFVWVEFVLSGNLVQAIDNVKGENSVPIMTIHKSKGLEYEIVIFVGLEDSAFWSYLTQSKEDTCAFFVALSRAKRKLVFTFSKDRYNRGFLETQTRVNLKPFYDMLSESGVVTEINY